MAITVNVNFDHQNKKKSDQACPIELRVTVNRRSYYIKTGISVKRSEFVSGTIVNRNDAEELNARLLILTRKAHEEINRCLEQGRAIDSVDLKRRLYGAAKVSSTTLIEWMEQQIPLLHLAPGTTKHYWTVINRLREYGEITSWNDLTVEEIYKFDSWLHTLRRPQNMSRSLTDQPEEFISDATVYTYHKCVKALLNRAERFGLIQRNPYARIRGEFKRGDKQSVEYLTESEMQAFIALRPTPHTHMELARDLFVFQLYTGLSYSDTQKFDIRDYKNEDGRWIHIGRRIKTGVPYVSQLLPPVIEVIEKYGWKAPRMDNSDYNRTLKALGMAAGITTPLHSHLARHTFATYMLRNGVKIENVSKMLGHTNILQTQRYAKVLAQSVKEDFDRISDILTQKKREE